MKEMSFGLNSTRKGRMRRSETPRRGHPDNLFHSASRRRRRQAHIPDGHDSRAINLEMTLIAKMSAVDEGKELRFE